MPAYSAPRTDSAAPASNSRNSTLVSTDSRCCSSATNCAACSNDALWHVIRSRLHRVVAPVHQRVPPCALMHIFLRPLREMASRITDNLAHVRVVVLGQIALLGFQNRHDV